MIYKFSILYIYIMYIMYVYVCVYVYKIFTVKLIFCCLF